MYFCALLLGNAANLGYVCSAAGCPDTQTSLDAPSFTGTNCSLRETMKKRFA